MNSSYSPVTLNILLVQWLRYGRNTAEHTTWLGTTGPQVTLEFKCPQTEMPHPDDACIGVMTTEKWCHNDVRGPLAGLPERSHHTLWCTCTAVSESPGHFNLTVLFVITNHLITLYDHLFDRQAWFSPRFIHFLGKSISYHCSDDCLAHDNFVNSWPIPQRFLVLVFTFPHPNLDIFSP